MAIASIEKVKEELCALKRKNKRESLIWGAAAIAPSLAAALVQTYVLGEVAPQFSGMREEVVFPAIFWSLGAGLGAVGRSALLKKIEKVSSATKNDPVMEGPSIEARALLKEEMPTTIAPCVSWDLSKVSFVSELDMRLGPASADKEGNIRISLDHLKQTKKDEKWFALAHEEGHYSHGDIQKSIGFEAVSLSALLLNGSLYIGVGAAGIWKMIQGTLSSEHHFLLVCGTGAFFAAQQAEDYLKRKMERSKEYNADAYAVLCLGSAREGKKYFDRMAKTEALLELIARPALHWKLDALLMKICGGDACVINQKSFKHKAYESASNALSYVFHQMKVLNRTHPTHASRIKNMERLEKRMIKRGVFAPPSPK